MPPRRMDVSDTQVCELVLQGFSFREVARLLGCTSTTVVRRFYKSTGKTPTEYNIEKRRKYWSLKGKRINKWVVIDLAPGQLDPLTKDSKWLCRCECGEESVFPGERLMYFNPKSCRSCSKRKGYKGITGKFWYDYRRGAEVRGWAWEISIEYAWDLFIAQNESCALTGVPLYLPDTYKRMESYSDFTASIDRIDSSLGYTIGNVQWVHKHINLMKQSFSQARFIELCKAVAHYHC